MHSASTAAILALLSAAAPAAWADAPTATPAPQPASSAKPAIALLSLPPTTPDVKADLRQLFISPAGKPFHAAPGQPYPVAAWFAEADLNHDGRLTREEFLADAAAFFAVLDLNKDGEIDGVELSQYEEKIAPELLPPLQPGEGRKAADPLLGAGAYGLANEPEPVSAADTNFNGRITAPEFAAAADRRFTRLDKASLGYLTLESLPQTAAQKAAKGKKRR